MSMIFNGFDSMDTARKFVEAVRERFGLDGQTFSSAEAAHEHDRFPWEQEPPIAHIERPDWGWDHLDNGIEAAVHELVSEFGGEFLGT
jgi:hypothetical protein